MSRPSPLAPSLPLPWTVASTVPPSVRPAGLWSWLTDPGSLTQRLRARAGDAFALRVLAESREPLRAGDAQRMGCTARQPALIREVRLDVGGRAAIHAVSVLPESTLAAVPALADLGARPLGDALFGRADVEREPLEIACLAADHALAVRALRAAEEQRAQVWARRSVVRVAGQPLLIHECFIAEWEW